MNLRFLLATAITGVTVLAFAPAPSKAQSGANAGSIPRLMNGKPDFSGVWDHPRVYDITKNGKGCGSDSPGCTQTGAGQLPYTEWGLAQWKAPNKYDYSGHCQPFGYTREWASSDPIEILQKPDRLAIMWELNTVFHVVPTDGRTHPKDADPVWMGNSIGSWDGDTLVIDTDNFNGKTTIDTEDHPSSDALHVVERLSYVDANHVSYEVTWDDPKTYTRPFKNVRTMTRMKPGEELMEYWCMENNKDLLDGHIDGTARK